MHPSFHTALHEVYFFLYVFNLSPQYCIQIGKMKVFLRAGQMAELDARRTEVLANAARLIQRQILTYLTRKDFISLRRAAICMQKHWRGCDFSFNISLLFHLIVSNSRMQLIDC